MGFARCCHFVCLLAGSSVAINACHDSARGHVNKVLQLLADSREYGCGDRIGAMKPWVPLPNRNVATAVSIPASPSTLPGAMRAHCAGKGALYPFAPAAETARLRGVSGPLVGVAGGIPHQADGPWQRNGAMPKGCRSAVNDGVPAYLPWSVPERRRFEG